MSAKKKCCCNTTVGPCACNPGAPWVAGRSEFVKMRATFSGITPVSPGLPWATVIFTWWGVNSAPPIAPWCDIPGYTPTPAEICAHETTIYNEGNTWRTGGGSVPDADSDPFDRSGAGCGNLFSLFFTNPPRVLPDIGTDFDIRSTGRVVVNVSYDATANKTRVSIQGTTGFDRAIVQYTFHEKLAASPPCSTAEEPPEVITRNLFESNSYIRAFLWFSHLSEFDGRLCSAASHTFSNQLALYTPAVVDSCGRQFGGGIAICQTGTCTLTLIDA